MLDVMHVERNVLENVLKYLFGKKDSILETRKDLEQVGVMRHLWLHQQDEGVNYIKPLVSCILGLCGSSSAPIGYVVHLRSMLGLRS
jgi:hypothetical protein